MTKKKATIARKRHHPFYPAQQAQKIAAQRPQDAAYRSRHRSAGRQHRRDGMLQNPVVEPELKDNKPTGFYLVTIGEGRRQAQLLRAKRKEITKTEPIRCVVDTAHDAFEISLAENAIRSAMHPADQFEAFFTRCITEQGTERRGYRRAVRRHRRRGAAAAQARRRQPDADPALPRRRNEPRPVDRLHHHRRSRQAGSGLGGAAGTIATAMTILAALTEEQSPPTIRAPCLSARTPIRRRAARSSAICSTRNKAAISPMPRFLSRLAAEKLQGIADGIVPKAGSGSRSWPRSTMLHRRLAPRLSASQRPQRRG